MINEYRPKISQELRNDGQEIPRRAKETINKDCYLLLVAFCCKEFDDDTPSEQSRANSDADQAPCVERLHSVKNCATSYFAASTHKGAQKGGSTGNMAK